MNGNVYLNKIKMITVNIICILIKSSVGFSLILSGEIDHIRSQSRFGVGITMEN